MILFYTEIAGLRYVKYLPKQISLNSIMYKKYQHNRGHWFIYRIVLSKERIKKFAWISINRANLPNEMKIQALLLGIQL